MLILVLIKVHLPFEKDSRAAEHDIVKVTELQFGFLVVAVPF